MQILYFHLNVCLPAPVAVKIKLRSMCYQVFRKSFEYMENTQALTPPPKHLWKSAKRLGKSTK